MGAEIKRARRARDWSQDQLAKQLGVSRATVVKWEADQATPRGDEVYELLELIPPGDRSPGADEPPSPRPGHLSDQELVAQMQVFLSELARRMASGETRSVPAPTRESHPGHRRGQWDVGDVPGSSAQR